MTVSNREYNLSESLITLQSQYNKLLSDKEYWQQIASQRLSELERMTVVIEIQRKTIYSLQSKILSLSFVPFAWSFLLFSYYYLFVQVARTYYRSVNMSEGQYDKAIQLSDDFWVRYTDSSKLTCHETKF